MHFVRPFLLRKKEMCFFLSVVGCNLCSSRDIGNILNNADTQLGKLKVLIGYKRTVHLNLKDLFSVLEFELVVQLIQVLIVNRAVGSGIFKFVPNKGIQETDKKIYLVSVLCTILSLMELFTSKQT